jgi:hypothetical protein
MWPQPSRVDNFKYVHQMLLGSFPSHLGSNQKGGALATIYHNLFILHSVFLSTPDAADDVVLEVVDLRRERLPPRLPQVLSDGLRTYARNLSRFAAAKMFCLYLKRPSFLGFFLFLHRVIP